MFLNDHFGCYTDNRIEMEKGWKRVSVRRLVTIVCVTSVRSDNSLGCYGGTRDEEKCIVVVLNPLTFFLLKDSPVPCPLAWAEHTDSLEYTEYGRKGPLPRCPTPRHCGSRLFSLCAVCSWRIPRATYATRLQSGHGGALSGGTEASLHLPGWTRQASMWLSQPGSGNSSPSEASRNWGPGWHLPATSWGTLSQNPQLSFPQLWTGTKSQENLLEAVTIHCNFKKWER